MASPIGHALGGLLVYTAGTGKKLNRLALIGALLFSVLPDIDFLFGFIVGEPNRYHHGFTHSIVFVALAGSLGAWLCSFKNFRMFRFYWIVFVLSGLSHLLFDIFTIDNNPPFGAPLLWPFSNHYYIIPVRLFTDMHRAADSSNFIKSLFNPHNGMAVVREIYLVLPLVIITFWLKKRFSGNEVQK